MPRRGQPVEYELNPELEKTCRIRRAQSRLEQEMEDEARRLEAERVRALNNEENQEQQQHRLLRDYLQPCGNGIQTIPGGQIRPYQIDPAFINMVSSNQFSGTVNDNPNLHLLRFEKLCQTICIQGLSSDELKLRLFPFSLRDRAQSWLDGILPGSITTWDEMVQKFMKKFFPPSRILQLRSRITEFKQRSDESVAEAWERLREYMRACPQHGFETAAIMHIFYQGLTTQNRNWLNASSGGTFMSKTAEGAKQILDAISEDVELWGSTERAAPTKAGMYEVGASTLLDAKLDMVVSRLEKIESSISKRATESQTTSTTVCSYCGGMHQTYECANARNEQPVEDIHYVQNRGHINPYTNAPQPYTKQGPPGFQPRPYYQNEQKPKEEDDELKQMVKQLMKMQVESNKRSDDTNKRMEDYMVRTDAELMNQRASIKNLEQQVGAIAHHLNQRNQVNLPSNTDLNPTEHCNAITTRSGLTTQDPKPKHVQQENVNEKMVEEEAEEEVTEPPQSLKRKKESFDPNKPIPLPYPKRAQLSPDETAYRKFFNIFKKLEINIPLIDALLDMPKYAKFLKDILSRKRKIDNDGVFLAGECEALLGKPLPTKMKDPGRFTIPCTIGEEECKDALCDSGASINLMPVSLYRKLGLGDMKPTRMIIQMADRSQRAPMGIIEDVLVKIDKFILPVDFVVLDINANFDVPLIFGSPFLATCQAMLDYKDGTVTLRVGDEKVKFDVRNTIKYKQVNEIFHCVDNSKICDKKLSCSGDDDLKQGSDRKIDDNCAQESDDYKRFLAYGPWRWK